MRGFRYRQVHLDFHTSEQIYGVGAAFDGEAFVHTLKDAGVDSITCFSRCHHGMIYHDTKFPAKHPYLTRNLLAEQIESCHKHSIKVPIYVSVGFDEFMARRYPEWIELDKDKTWTLNVEGHWCKRHPEWTELGKNGKISGALQLDAGWKKLCLNSPYADYVVEQTEEIIDTFRTEVDGLFFDIILQGECCCRYCMDGMLKGGYDPESQDDRRRFASMVVETFKKRMTSAIRAKSKDCSIFYNAGHIGPSFKPSLQFYTHLELESLPSGEWGYEHFPITARYARNLGYQFLGMTGKFAKSWADFGGFKNPAALEYECFRALALGGGCSIGDQLHPSGAITKATYELIGNVYREIESKEPWCRNAVPVVEIGVITPEPVSGDRLSESAGGVHGMLAEQHYQFDFIDLEMDLSKYKVVVVPDLIRLTEQAAGVLNKYVSDGGKLLVSYESGMAREGYEFLLENMPARVKGPAPFSPDYLVAEESIATGIVQSEHVMYERGLEIEPSFDAKSLAQVWKPYFERSSEHFCSHFHTPVEEPARYPGIVANESIVYIGYPIFGMYKRHGARVYRDLVINALKFLLPHEEQLIITDAPTTASVTLNYQPEHDRYILHMLHYIPERRYRATDTIEDIIPLYNVTVDLLLPNGYDKAEFVPERTKMEVSRSGSRLKLVVPKINGHAMLSIER